MVYEYVSGEAGAWCGCAIDIRSVKEGLRSIPNKGIGFGAFATMAGSPYTHKDLPPVSFNYLGQFDKDHGDWEIAGSEGSGVNLHPSNADHHVVNINGLVSNGRLWFSIITKLGEAVTAELSECFKRHLRDVIVHCGERLDREGGSHTPGDFSTVGISQSLIDELESAAWAGGNEIVHIYPATSLQQGFIYHALSQQGDDAYRVQLLFDYHGSLDVKKYVQAWEYCIARYPILRTGFNWEEEVIQVMYRDGQLDYSLHDISELATQEDRDAAITSIQSGDRQRGFI